MNSFSATYGELSWTEGKYKVKPRLDLLELLDTRPRSMLELGCADGTNLVFFRDSLRARGFEIERLVGVDAQAIRGCRNYAEFEFVHSTVEQFIEQCREAFDLVVLSDVVEHLFNPWQALKALRDRLDADGRLLISVPNIQNLNYLFRVASGEFRYEDAGLMDVTHIRFFSQKTLASLLESSGFALCRTGFRPDLSLRPAIDEWRRRVAQGEVVTVTRGACSLAVDARNIDLISAQQLLVCARKKAI
jgi:2-polyprenyl-3-methyl-5-hydroxy-6-metoxy-1,4-benzoquinol methylase